MPRLGKLARRLDRRTLHLENYLNMAELPVLPPGADWFAKVPQFNMGGNDQYGDCVVCGAAHMIQAWTASAGRRMQAVDDQTIIQTYLKLTGGQDVGLVLLDFLNFWRTTGFADHKIGAFAAVNPKNLTSMRYANYLFGGVYLGLQLPLSAQDQDVWEVPPGGLSGDGAPGSWGGHCVNAGAYGPDGKWQVITWGARQFATDEFLMNYCDEAYALLALEFFDVGHQTPAGFHWRDLQADLQRITGGTGVSPVPETGL